MVAETINGLFGEGKQHVSGYIDLSPDSLEHITEYAFGGAGKFGLRSVAAVEKWAKGEELKPRDIPFYRRLVGEADGDQVSMGDFYQRSTRVGQRVKHLRSLKGAERLKYREDNLGYLETNGLLTAIQKHLRQLRKVRKEAQESAAMSPENAINSARIQEWVEDQIQNDYDKFNRFYDKKVGRAK